MINPYEAIKNFEIWKQIFPDATEDDWEDSTLDERKGFLQMPALHDFKTGEFIREATEEEWKASAEAYRYGEKDGMIVVKGRNVYIIDF